MTTEEKLKKFMTEHNLDPGLVERIKRFIGYSDEDILKTTPRQHRSWKAQDKLNEWLLVAEVVESHNCGAKNKVGDRYVIQSATSLVPQECTVRFLCTEAIVPLSRLGHILYERLAEGLDPRDFVANEYVWCEDTGVEHGGYGRILMKCRFEHVSEFKSLKDESYWSKIKKK
jgi:hypothetical protein